MEKSMSHKISTQGLQSFARAVPLEQETLIVLDVAPHSAYRIFHGADPKKHLQLDSDERGRLSFYLTVPRNTEPFELHLVKAGEELAHPIAISADPHYWERHDEAKVQSHAAKGAIRPALTGFPQGVSNKELTSRGYPPQPNPERSPTAHARWRELVSKPYTLVNDFRVPHEDIRFGSHVGAGSIMSPTLPLPPPSPELAQSLKFLRRSFPRVRQWERSFFNATSSTWSGALVQQPVNNFFLVQADWQVPRVGPTPGASWRAEAAVWVGLGNGSNDLFQSGTDSVSVTFPLAPHSEAVVCLTNYWMWIEVLPFAPWAVPNFPIGPGDEVSVNIHVADQAGNVWFREDNEGGGLTAQDNSVWFMLYNRTRGLSYWGIVPTQTPSDSFNGNIVEFILEQPSNSEGGTWPLANFGTARMRNCAYGDAQFGNLQQFSIPPDDGSQPFDGNVSYLNMVNPSNGHRLATAISCPDASSFGGNDIFWLWSNSQ
jgi:hypothetical protein